MAQTPTALCATSTRPKTHSPIKKLILLGAAIFELFTGTIVRAALSTLPWIICLTPDRFAALTLHL
jgi:hypothetical protein